MNLKSVPRIWFAKMMVSRDRPALIRLDRPRNSDTLRYEVRFDSQSIMEDHAPWKNMKRMQPKGEIGIS
jgi:hypothetical protein